MGFVLSRLEPHAGVIVKRYMNGESYEDIARDFNCAASTIRRFLLTQDISLRSEGRKRKLSSVSDEVTRLFRAGERLSRIAAHYGVTEQTVINFLFSQGVILENGLSREERVGDLSAVKARCLDK